MAAKLDIRRCFEILELDPGATVEDAKKARRDLVSVWHPDRVPSSNPRLQKKASTRLKEINAAYDMLLPYLSTEQNEAHRPDFGQSSRPTTATETWPETEFSADLQPDARSDKGLRKNIALVLMVLFISAGFAYFIWENTVGLGYEPKIKVKRFQGKKEKKADQIENAPAKIETDINKQQNAVSARQEKSTNAMDSSTLVIQYQKEPSALRLKEIVRIDDVVAGAENMLKSKEYVKSKQIYESALKMINNSQFKEDRHYGVRKQRILEALLNKDIVYGTKGFIKYENKWIAPDEYQKHFVKYKGGVRHFKELKNVITQITDPHIRLYLIAKYGDQTIHKKKVECYQLALNKKNKSSSHFRLFYRWEIWTFKTIDEGDLSLDIVYHSDKDQWQIGDINESKYDRDVEKG